MALSLLLLLSKTLLDTKDVTLKQSVVFMLLENINMKIQVYTCLRHRSTMTALPQTIGHSVVLLVICGSLLFGTCTVNGKDIEEKQSEITLPENHNADNQVPQVRYRTRPVAAFRSGPKITKSDNTTNSSSEADGREASGVPFIAVHDLTSQTFEKLQENWKNLEAFIRNLQARRSQEESLRSASSANGGVPSTAPAAGDTTNRRPPFNNVYFKYHPVVLQGEGSSSVDDLLGGSTNGNPPPRPYNGISFNPFPYDPKGESNKNIDMERHTVATIYTIGICLTIMAIGSVMFILINKCDGTGSSGVGSNYIRASGVSSASNRLTRGVIGATRGGRQTNSGNNGRNRNGRNGRSNNENSQTSSNSGNLHGSDAAESVGKIPTDLPPSYDSLFPEGVPKQQDVEQPTTSSAAAAAAAAANSNNIPPPVICDSVDVDVNPRENFNEELRPSGSTAAAAAIT